MTDLFDLTVQLCAIPSVSGDEGPLADLVEASLRERAAQLEITRIGANVIARTNNGAPERVVLGGHLDTVPPTATRRRAATGTRCTDWARPT